MDLREMAKSLHDALEEVDVSSIAPDVEAARLQDALSSYGVRHELRVGDVVRQKPGARLYKTFGYNDLGIVVEFLDPPVMINEKANDGSPYFRLVCDMLVASVEADGTFNVYHVESARFEPATPEMLAEMTESWKEKK